MTEARMHTTTQAPLKIDLHMFASPTLTVNLAAIASNWLTLKAAYSGEEVAAVVKANAYGLGAAQVATALEAAGCHTFFVATLEEGIALRAALPDVRILVFHGVQAGEEFAFRTHRLIPVLNSPAQIARWQPVAAEFRDAISGLHIDTAMARLGLTEAEWEALQHTHEMFEQCRISLILSHLACASDEGDARNAEQLARFRSATATVRGIPLSLANSGGILLGPDYHFHLARPGCALYGIHPSGYTSSDFENSRDHGDAKRGEVNREARGGGATAPLLPAKAGHIKLQQVATLTAPILQLRTLTATQQVGYGGTETLPKGSRIATVACGYADGYLRSISSSGAYGLLRGKPVPLVGRVTMDMLTFDVSGITGDVHEGEPITLLGHNKGEHGEETITIDQLAHWAGTIGYECFTRLGDRIKRVYT